MSYSLHTQRVIFLLCLLLGMAAVGGYVAYKQGWGDSLKTNNPQAPVNLDLKSTLEELDRTDPGWRFEDLNARRAELPPTDNAATMVQAAVAALPRDWPRSELIRELNRLGPRDALSKKLSADLDEELKKPTQALAEARKLADHPQGRYSIAWKPVYLTTELPQVQQIPKVFQLLSFLTVKEIHANDPAAALASAQALLNTARSVGDEPALASHVVRISLHPLTIGILERILVQTQPDDAALAVMQRALQDEAAQPLLLTVARGERAMLDNVLRALETQELKKADLEDDDPAQPELHKKLLRILNDRAQSEEAAFKQAHAWLLHYLTEFVELAKLPVEQQRPRLEKLELRRAEAPSAARTLAPDAAGIALGFAKSQALLHCAAVGVAVERYRLAKGNWPAQLADLTPTYLATEPLDPFDGKPLRFKKQPDGVLVYSLGVDRLDKAADFASVNTYVRGTVGFRLWNMDKRRQPMK